MKYISISGAVAAGKTTLLNTLMEHYGERAVFHEEQPELNPFIEQYYADPVHWSFHSQVTFLTLYFENTNWLNADHDLFFFDRCLIENLVIARYRLEAGHLTQDEYNIIEKLAFGIHQLMPTIDKYIYLRCSVPLLMDRLKERGREYESDLTKAFTEHQKALYDQWAAALPADKLLILDEDEGFDIQQVYDFIEN